MVKTLQSMTDLTRQGLMDATHKLRADDIPMLLPGVTVDGTAQGTSPIRVTRLLRLAGGKWVWPPQSEALSHRSRRRP